MSDFGAGACDFASDFRTEGNDYASDFRGEPRTAKWPPETSRPPKAHHRSRVQPPTRPQANEDGGKLAAHRASGKPRSRRQRHAIRP